MHNLTCKEFIDFLDEYFAGNQPPATRAAFEAHLRACRHCADYLHSYRQTVELARASAGSSIDQVAPEPPEALVRAVLAATSLRPSAD